MLQAPVQKYKFILMPQDEAPLQAFFLKKEGGRYQMPPSNRVFWRLSADENNGVGRIFVQIFHQELVFLYFCIRNDGS